MPEKYQDEIEEILKGIEDKGPVTPTRESERPHRGDHEAIRPGPPSIRDREYTGRRLPTITPGKLALAGIICILIGWLWTKVLIWVGLGLLVGTYLLLFVRPRSIYMEKRWRGQSMENSYTPWQRFKRWLQS
ncbi:MAG: hypothetical protein ACE5Q6_01775 [Dehalococcoidia bacterium]